MKSKNLSKIINNSQIKRLCETYHVKRLSIFGSYLRDDFTPSSDIDMLVEFMPGCIPGLDFFLFEYYLSETIGRKVDLQTAKFLNPRIRDTVVSEARVAYEQA